MVTATVYLLGKPHHQETSTHVHYYYYYHLLYHHTLPLLFANFEVLLSFPLVIAE
jgi:hypothetical protein